MTAFHVISNKNREDVNIDNGSLIAGRISKLLKSDFISFPHELEISPFAVNEELRNVSLGLDSKLCNGLESINEMWHPSLRQASEFGFLSIDFANVEEKIAVEFDGPTHYIEDLSLGPGHNKRYLRENGSTAFKTRLLSTRFFRSRFLGDQSLGAQIFQDSIVPKLSNPTVTRIPDTKYLSFCVCASMFPCVP